MTDTPKNRYSLVEYMGQETSIVSSFEEYKNFTDRAIKNNKDVRSKYYYGNISCERINGEYRVVYQLFNRLCMPTSLEKINNETIKYTDMNDLRKGYKSLIDGDNNDICIAYFYDKKKNAVDVDISTLSVYFKPDAKYLEDSYLKKCITDFANEKKLNFFLKMSGEFNRGKALKNAINLREIVNRYPVSITDLDIQGKELFYNYTRNIRKVERAHDSSSYEFVRDENGKITRNYRRLVDFADFIRFYGTKDYGKAIAQQEMPHFDENINKKNVQVVQNYEYTDTSVYGFRPLEEGEEVSYNFDPEDFIEEEDLKRLKK